MAEKNNSHTNMEVITTEDSDPGVGSDSESIILSSDNRNLNLEENECMNCGTSDSEIWRRYPGDSDKKRKSHRKLLCDKCGIYWLKYGFMRIIAEPPVAGKRGRPSKAEIGKTKFFYYRSGMIYN